MYINIYKFEHLVMKSVIFKAVVKGMAFDADIVLQTSSLTKSCVQLKPCGSNSWVFILDSNTVRVTQSQCRHDG